MVWNRDRQLLLAFLHMEGLKPRGKQTFDLRPQGTNEVFPPTDFTPETVFILSDNDCGS